MNSSFELLDRILKGNTERLNVNGAAPAANAAGPALHIQDRELLTSGIIGFADVVTIRQGEIVVQPDTGQPIAYRGGIDQVPGAGRAVVLPVSRSRRPGPVPSTSTGLWPVVSRNAGSRTRCWRSPARSCSAVLTSSPRTIRCCPWFVCMTSSASCRTWSRLRSSLANAGKRDRTLAELKEMVEKDLMFRTIAIDQFQLSVAQELFYFGRPLFQLLIPLGVSVTENATGLLCSITNNNSHLPTGYRRLTGRAPGPGK